MAKLILVLNFLVFPMASENQTGYQSWKHSGSLFILTNPDGANLPQGASVHNFPLLIRLHKDFFDFQQANNQGADIRFSTISGIPLAYQIEQWDPENAHAAIWVRIPKIEGNTTQEIKIHWGNPAATSESDGKRVFNAENGYLGVWHMGQTNQDEVGAMGCVDTGTTQATGMVGQARHFPGQKGIVAGEKITTLPTGSNPHTTEAWFRAEKINNQVMAWGNEQGQGKVVMRFRSPPSVKMECYFSGADVVNKTPLAMNQWIHVAHTYQKGESRVYVNGLLDGQSITQSAPLAIKTPARLFIGGWYNNYDFVGDIDEVRISNKVRSPEWIRLQFENQKTNQSLVGPIVQSGNQFAVFPTKLEISEGKNATLRATAPGARKIYWSIQRDGKEEIASVDRLSLAFAPGRVVGDQSATIRCKAVYPDGVKTAEIPVKILEAIPEPHFSLKLPPLWNGRDTIELAPTIHNLQALRAKSADSLQFQWKATGMAVIQQVAPGRLILKRSQNSGPLTISLTVSNGGAESTRSGTIQVTQSESDPWLMRSPEPDEKPEQGQFFPRDDKNQGTLFYNGRLDQPADEVYLKLFANDLPFNSQTQKVPSNRAYNFTVKLKPGLIKYRVEFGIKTPTGGKILNTVDDLVCGDAYLIQGQSNALATDTNEKSPPDTNDWIRSYGGKSGREDATTWVHDQFTKAKANGAQRPNLWCKPVWKAEQGEKPNSVGGEWSSPTVWLPAKKYPSASSTAPWAAPASTNTNQATTKMPTYAPFMGGLSGACNRPASPTVSAPFFGIRVKVIKVPMAPPSVTAGKPTNPISSNSLLPGKRICQISSTTTCFRSGPTPAAWVMAKATSCAKSSANSPCSFPTSLSCQPWVSSRPAVAISPSSVGQNLPASSSPSSRETSTAQNPRPPSPLPTSSGFSTTPQPKTPSPCSSINPWFGKTPCSRSSTAMASPKKKSPPQSQAMR